MLKFSRISKIQCLIFILLVGSIETIGVESMFGPGFPFNNDFGAQMQRHMAATMGTMRRNMDNMLGQMNHRRDVLGAEFYGAMEGLKNQMTDMNLKFEATRMISAMLRGTGGSTWINFNGNNVIVKNQQMIACQGSVYQTNNGFECEGTISRVNSVCVPGSKSYSQLNDQFCIFDDTASTHSAYILNGRIICEHGYLYTTNELQQQCGPNVLTDHYALVRYIPNVNDPQHVPIPTNNPYLKCHSSNICEFNSNFSGFISFF